MLSNALLDTLVKLASLGTSGICIFAIFWIGWLILNPPSTPDKERHKTLRFFMIICAVIAVISAVTGITNAKFNADKISELEKQLSQHKEKEKIYIVEGTVEKSDKNDPRNILISTRYPPLYPDFNGKIINLEVKKGYDGRWPNLSFNHPNYGTVGVDLNDEGKAKFEGNRIIIREPIKLMLLPAS